MASISQAHWFTVNKRLLPVKGIYFLSGGATGDLYPFITIYMKQLGLSSTEAGIIYGVMPFVSFFVQPLFGALADKTKQHKMVLIVCLLMTGLFHGLLLVTPDKHGGSSIKDGILTVMNCGKIGSFIRDCHKDQNNEQCDMGLHRLSHHYNLTDVHVNCEAVCKTNVSEYISTLVCFTHGVDPTMSDPCTDQWNSSSIEPNLNFTINSFILDNKVIVDDIYTNRDQICYDYSLTNISYNNQHYCKLLCSSDVVFDCKLNCEPDYRTTCFSVKSLSKTFWIFFVIFLFGSIFFSPVVSLINAISYNIIGEKRGDWGRQRNWGSVGYTLFAVTSTVAMDVLSKSKQKIDYSISFYIFVILCVASSVVVYFVQISKSLRCNNMFQNLKELMKYPEVVTFLIVVGFFGIFNSVIEAFLFWFLKDLGSTQINLGLCVVFNCVPEIIVFHYAGRIIKQIGDVPCLYIGAAAFAIRFFSYSFLTNTWYVLPVEMLHGFTFGLFYATVTSYGSKITPTGMSGTVQGLISGLYYGFGKGTGSLITGKIIEPETGIGARWTFRFYGFLAVFLLLTYGTIQNVFFRKKTDSPTKATDVKEAKDEEAVGDVLPENNTVTNDQAKF